MTDIKNQKLLYHLTSIKNIANIIEHGLKPRNELSEFVDVADSEILESRKSLSLEGYVPFHFFCKNPFDGRVQKDRPNEKFALITVKREFAKNQNWQIIPCHPLANVAIELLSYEKGVNEINWELMETRDYGNPDCKSTCMAECLSPVTVEAKNFYAIYVCCSESKEIISEHKRNKSLSFYLNETSEMFVR
ncbi:MAG: DarT ssDNA thymidine ADP-ribosyltransferase family protein [Methylococcaceae bacterium]